VAGEIRVGRSTEGAGEGARMALGQFDVPAGWGDAMRRAERVLIFEGGG
jgi:hypothetical protein